MVRPSSKSNKPELYSDRLFAAGLASDRDRREPVVAVALLAPHDGVELLLQCLGDRTNRPFADLDLIHGTDPGNLGRGAGEECFVGDVEHLARNHLLHNWDA